MSQGNYCKLESDNHFPSPEALDKLAHLYETTPQEIILGAENGQQIQYNNVKDSPHTVNAYMVWQDPRKLVDDLLTSKEKIIALQAKQIEMLDDKLRGV